MGDARRRTPGPATTCRSERVPGAQPNPPPRALRIDLPEARREDTVDTPSTLHVIAHQLEQAHPSNAAGLDFAGGEAHQSPPAVHQIEQVEHIGRELERLPTRRRQDLGETGVEEADPGLPTAVALEQPAPLPLEAGLLLDDPLEP